MKNLIGSKSRFLTGVAIVFAILSISNSCSKPMDNPYGTGSTTGGAKGGSGGPGTNEVWIQGMAFSPSTITVAAGTTITWTNQDAVNHTVTSTDNTGLLNSSTISNGGTYSYMFATAGTYAYYCKVHPSMTATVVVN